MPTMSLRRRIALAFALLICTTLTALAASLLLTTTEREEELIDEIVNATLHQIEARWPVQEQLLLPKNLYFYHAPIGQEAADLPAEINRFAAGNSEYYARDREYHVGVREYQGERLYLLYDTQLHEERLRSIYWGVICAVLLLAGLALIVGHFFAGTILRQFTALTSAVETDQPIDITSLRDRELRVLAQAISESRAQKIDLLQKEREFSAHVGHELRTPLTKVRNSAELLRELGQLSSADVARVGQIEAAVEEMEQRLRSLMFLARDLRGVHKVRVNLHHAVSESMMQFTHLQPHIERINQIDPVLEIEADPNLLKILLDNLLSNALRYTHSGRIVWFWQSGCLCLADTGLGIAQHDLVRLAQPFERASELPDGMGLGLAIVKRICDALQWQLSIQSAVGQGTRVCVQIEHD